MKLNRFFALAAIALLVVGAMGAIASRSFALGSHKQVAGVSDQADACAQDQANGSEVTSATDTDTANLQCGDQKAADSSLDTADKGAAETVSATDTDTANVQEQVGDQNGPDNAAGAPETADPTNK